MEERNTKKIKMILSHYFGKNLKFNALFKIDHCINMIYSKKMVSKIPIALNQMFF
jgi:hypothetical protein